MTKTRTLTEIELLEASGELARLLGAVVDAHLVDDEERVDLLLGQITAAQCRGVAEELLALTLRRKLAATPPRRLPASSNALDADTLERERRRLSSVGEHGLVIALDPHSRRV